MLICFVNCASSTALTTLIVRSEALLCDEALMDVSFPVDIPALPQVENCLNIQQHTYFKSQQNANQETLS